MYLALINNEMVIQNNMIWRLKIPLKIKIFMWYMYKEVVLTKDNLARRNWNGGLVCLLLIDLVGRRRGPRCGCGSVQLSKVFAFCEDAALPEMFGQI
jgi:hypothetical protein